ncbi:MAG: xanthine dehydrogenase family protein molybdopterin-binding subunit [Chloroflexi bacterium]|nr:xanthine dehydrogenase family protein molybdopterin-binding subunit [Chloroflexota bacterium]
MSKPKVVGQRVPRVDVPDKVTGRAIFAADVAISNALASAVLRSPHAHAKIRRLDVSRARTAEGVAAVITGQDLLQAQGLTMEEARRLRPALRQHYLAWDKVIYAGQAVAVVAATTQEAAQKALGLIQVDYELLPSVTDVETAMKPGAPALHPNLAVRISAKVEVSDNVVMRTEIRKGDVAAGFAQADIVLEETFRTQMVHQGYMEPHAVTASVAADGKITVWTTTQGSFSIRQGISQTLNIPDSQLRVIPTEVGGGFGAKAFTLIEPLCVLLAQKAGRPVKMVMSREEEFIAATPAPPVVYRLKMGATRDGRITAAEGTAIFDAGAFAGEMAPSAMDSLALYKVPNLSLEHFQVVTNKPPVGAYRAPNHPQGAFASESMLDMIAQSLSLDPLELRLRNAVQDGDATPDGVPLGRIGFKETLQRIREHPIWREKPKAGRSRGLACGVWTPAALTSTAQLQVTPDGSFALTMGSVDITGVRTTMAQIVAEEFGLDMKEVAVTTGDTDTAGYADVSGGSRTTRTTGTAVLRACQDVKAQLRERAAAQLRVSIEDLEYGDKKFWANGSPKTSVSIEAIAGKAVFGRGDVIVGHGQCSRLGREPAYAVHVAEISVDRETGQVQVERYVAAQDVGFALNPTLVEGQLQGSAVQGIGWALSEGYVYRNGILQNPNFLDYRMLTAADLPPIEPVLVEVAAPDGPYGARGVGEPPIIPPLAAVANAVSRAIGIRITSLPMTSEAVWRALKARGQA